jgi:hypothetical protein
MSNTEVKSYYAGSSWGLPPVRYGKCQVIGSLAQLGEHLPYKQRVSGSIPLTPIEYVIIYSMTIKYRKGSEEAKRGGL